MSEESENKAACASVCLLCHILTTPFHDIVIGFERGVRMTKQQPPVGIGPHEGRELELMLAGEKPLAMFVDVVPSPFKWPDADFAPFVSSGRLVMQDFISKSADGRHRIRTLFYALPGEEWRIAEAYDLSRLTFNTWSDEAANSCARLGHLLGYREEDIRSFVLWSDQVMPNDACPPSRPPSSFPMPSRP